MRAKIGSCIYCLFSVFALLVVLKGLENDSLVGIAGGIAFYLFGRDVRHVLKSDGDIKPSA